MENRLTSVTVGDQTTTLYYDANGQRIVTIQPNGTKIYTPFAEYEETIPTSGATTKRSSYFLAGQLIAVRVVTGGSSTLYFTFADHLGNVSALTYSGGTLVAGSLARYEPFGGFRTQPTSNPAITDRGFTGHKSNNTGTYDLDLIYMNARYYMPEIGRFISADTIVPDSNDPQSFNRYTYVNNNPIMHTDPSGHCQGSFNSESGQATDDQECWDFLYNDFCSGGASAICSNWQERLLSIQSCDVRSGSCSINFGNGSWTKGELLTLRDALATAIGILSGAGYDGASILSGIAFRRINGADSVTFPSNFISLSGVNPQTIWHEMGHSISFRNGRTPQDEYFWFAETFASTSEYTMGNFCYRSYCERGYGPILGIYTGQHPEYWADGFAAWVFMERYGRAPDNNPDWRRNDYTPNWRAISNAVEWSLIVTFDN